MCVCVIYTIYRCFAFRSKLLAIRYRCQATLASATLKLYQYKQIDQSTCGVKTTEFIHRHAHVVVHMNEWQEKI